MKAKKNIREKGKTKFVKINNSTWIETDVSIPDEVARMHYYQKTNQTQPSTYLGQLRDYVSSLNT
jgi:hypothetical protein